MIAPPDLLDALEAAVFATLALSVVGLAVTVIHAWRSTRQRKDPP